MRKYYYAGNQRVAMREDNVLRWLLGDHLGSTACTVYDTTALNGHRGEMRYLPWGGTRYTSGQTLTSYRFIGHREEVGLGLYYYGARWYDPALGRFIQYYSGFVTVTDLSPDRPDWLPTVHLLTNHSVYPTINLFLS